jgi:hypothetical protein
VKKKAENEKELELPKELLESIAGLNELMSQQQDQAAAMMYRLMFRHERNLHVLDHKCTKKSSESPKMMMSEQRVLQFVL